MCSAAISDLALPLQCPASIMLIVLMTTETGADDNWCQVEEVETLRETALENKAPVVAAASTGDKPQVPQVEALDAGEAEALDPPEAGGSVVQELEDPPSQEVAVVASQAVMKETKAVVVQNVPAVAPVPQNVVAGWEALAGMGTVVAASAPSVNACSIVSSVPSPIMPSNSLWLQPLWMQMELLQEGHVPGLTIGADPKELYICFV